MHIDNPLDFIVGLPTCEEVLPWDSKDLPRDYPAVVINVEKVFNPRSFNLKQKQKHIKETAQMSAHARRQVLKKPILIYYIQKIIEKYSCIKSTSRYVMIEISCINRGKININQCKDPASPDYICLYII